MDTIEGLDSVKGLKKVIHAYLVETEHLLKLH